MTAAPILHAGCVALWRPRLGWRGVLIQGPSGAGKSDLALRLVETGFALVSDDRTLVWRSGGRLFGRCPAPIAGMIEARGLGILPESALPLCEIVLSVLCQAPVERLPQPETTVLVGAPIAVLRLAALEASASAKIRRAMQSLGARPQEAYLAAAENPRGGTR